MITCRRRLLMITGTTIFMAMLFPVSRASAQGNLLRLLDQYRLPKTLHIKVTTSTDYQTIPPGIFHIDGTQEYWVDGPKFRLVQLMDSSMFPGMSHDLRWDGDHYQWFNVNDSTLVVSDQPKQKAPFIGEPMALLPLEFLNPGGDDLGVKLSLDDLRTVQVHRSLESAPFARSINSDLTIPGGTIGDMDTTYRLEFSGSPSYLPTTLRRMSPIGIELDTDEIHYEPVECAGGVIYLPCWARLTDRTINGQVDSVATWTVTAMEADVPIPAETFTIDFQTAKRVIDINNPTRRISSVKVQAAGLMAPGHPNSIKADSETGLVAAAGAPSELKSSGDLGQLTIGTLTRLLVGFGAIVGAFVVHRMKRNTGPQQ